MGKVKTEVDNSSGLEKSIFLLIDNREILNSLAVLFKSCRASELDSDEIEEGVGHLKGIGIMLEIIAKDLAQIQEVVEDAAAEKLTA